MTDDSAGSAGNLDAPSCGPCRGTGRLISNLGGSPSTVTCPWCEGTGRLIPGHDAQAVRSASVSEAAPET